MLLTRAAPSPTTEARAAPSTSELICDGLKPATLLGALPGLSPAALDAHAASLDARSLARGFRLVLKSYEVDVLAPTAEDARGWVRGVNCLPFGAKHCQLHALVRKQLKQAAGASADG